MPAPALAAMAKETGKSLKDLEGYWEQGKKAAKKAGIPEDTDNFYAYVMAIVKKRAGLKENLSFKEYFNLSKIEE